MSDSSPAPAGPQPSDLGADLSAAWDAQESPGSSAPASPAAGKASASTSSSGDAATAKADESGTRARDETGRFAKTNGTATTAPVGDKPDAKPAPRADAKAPDVKPDPKADSTDPKADAKPAEFKIPEKWPSEVRAKLEDLHKRSPDDAKWLLDQYAFQRGEATRWQQTQMKSLERLQGVQKTVEDLLAPGRQQRALQGIDDASYIRNLVAAGEVLDKNPMEGLRYLAQRYGIDIQKLANPQASGEPAISPEMRQIMQEHQALKQFIAKQHQDAQHGQLRAATDWIEKFASQADAQGQPLYPHFDEVLNEIIVNVQYQRQAGQPIDVKAAYDRAIRMNDQIWLKVQRANAEAEKKAAAAKHARDVEEAKRAGFSVSGSGGATSDKPAESLRGELERLYDATHR